MGDVIAWVTANWDEIVKWYLAIIGVASIIVKVTPTLKDDTILQSIIAFVGKYIALNRNAAQDDAARAAALKK